MATSVKEELTYQTVRCGIFPFSKRGEKKKHHIVCRHQKNDANVVKGLSVVGLVNVWQQVLHIISISGALLPFWAPVGEEPNKTVSTGRPDYSLLLYNGEMIP